MPASPTQPVRRPRFALRYSLGVLLVAFTSFAIGFPVWYRWPYEEEEPRYSMRTGQPDKTRPPSGTLVTTWQRQWGGGRLKHGPELTYRKDKLILRTTYRNGILHGPYETWLANGNHEIGQYIEGKKCGEWTLFDAGGKLRRSTQWLDDRLHGTCVIVERSGRKRPLEFVEGQITLADGRKINDQLGDPLRNGTIDDERIAKALASPANVQSTGAALLKEGPHWIGAILEVPTIADPHHVDPTKPIRCEEWEGIDAWCLLAIIGSDNDLGFDYRYGCLWITSPTDAENWNDLTGVADIVPPKGSQLARSWNGPVGFAALNQPLADVIEQQLVPGLAIAVDISQIRSNDEKEPTYLVTSNFKGLPFKHALGILLDQARCRCKLEGETLVILPPE